MINGESRIIRLEEREFRRISEFVMSHYGIKLPPVKKLLVQSRLQKRLKALNLNSFKDYTNYLFSSKGQQEEVTPLINAISTNTTDFFREPYHFEYLYSVVLPKYTRKYNSGSINIWSAGCSSGEEPYTVEITVREFCDHVGYINHSVLATDISTGVLQLAMLGIYNSDKISDINDNLKKKYFLRGKDKYANKVRILPELRNKVSFRKFNLLSTSYHALGNFDLIFCRNVLIYFERELQGKILNRFCQVLQPGGFLFLGHSESINGHDLPLKQLKPTIYQRL